MATIQGDFADGGAAEQAKQALKQAGIADTRIRTWNILEGSGAHPSRGSAIPAGAVAGGLIAGGAGLVAGAGIGALLDEGSDAGSSLPEPSGVCVVVDIAEDAQRIEAILRSSGASNIHTGLAAR